MAHNCFDSERSARQLCEVKQPRGPMVGAAVDDPGCVKTPFFM
jgi:hypothetical protein